MWRENGGPAGIKEPLGKAERVDLGHVWGCAKVCVLYACARRGPLTSVRRGILGHLAGALTDAKSVGDASAACWKTSSEPSVARASSNQSRAAACFTSPSGE